MREDTMKKKNRIILFALTTSILLSGCSLSRKQVPEQVIEPVIGVREEVVTVGGNSILKSIIHAPSTLEEKAEIITYINALEGDNQVVVYEGESIATKQNNSSENIVQDQTYSTEIFEASLKETPMVQIYYCGSKKAEEAEKEIALYYPNVTYVEENEKVEDVISTYYRVNYVTNSCIKGLRSGVTAVEEFDFEGTLEEAKGHFPDIDQAEVIDGLTNFLEYVENTTLFQKAETFSDKIEDALRPHVEAAIPALESAWDDAKPYLEQGKDKVVGFYEEIKPELEESYETTKEYVKSILGK